jgi:pyruvate/2-oxoglutarate/acetoin dehydrogenase E1 component
LRPVAELMFSDFLGVCFDQIFNQAAKFRYMFGGKARTPLVIRTMVGAGRSAAAQHSQSPYHIFTSVPGLKVVVPSNAYDAKGLLIQAIRDDDPVVFCEHKLMYDLRTEVPDEAYTIPFGEANVVRDGDDVTVVALARMVHYTMGPPRHSRLRGSNARSSTLGPRRRWMRTRSSTVSNAPDGWLSSMRRRRAAAWRPTLQLWLPTRRSPR